MEPYLGSGLPQINTLRAGAPDTLPGPPTTKHTHEMKNKRNTREALLIAAGTLFFPLLCIECWWINLLAVALLGGAALLNPEYIGG